MRVFALTIISVLGLTPLKLMKRPHAADDTGIACVRAALGSTTESDPPPALSVVLPVYNAMPWLPIAVRDLLKQRLDDDAPLEVVAAVDGCSDGSLPFLRELAAALGPERASVEQCAAPFAPGVAAAAQAVTNAAEVTNPALAQPLRAPETCDHPSFAAGHVAAGDGAGGGEEDTAPLTAMEVAALCRAEHRLVVLYYETNCGQGAAMSLALSRCRGNLIAQMESDDERPDATAFRTMLRALAANPSWDGVSCGVELCGSENRQRMAAYVAWQNSLLSPSAMASGRFIEIPALHQTAIFKRRAINGDGLSSHPLSCRRATRAFLTCNTLEVPCGPK